MKWLLLFGTKIIIKVESTFSTFCSLSNGIAKNSSFKPSKQNKIFKDWASNVISRIFNHLLHSSFVVPFVPFKFKLRLKNPLLKKPDGVIAFYSRLFSCKTTYLAHSLSNKQHPNSKYGINKILLCYRPINVKPHGGGGHGVGHLIDFSLLTLRNFI